MSLYLVLFMSCRPQHEIIMGYEYDSADAWPRNQWDGPPGSAGNPVYKGDVDLELKSGYFTAGGVLNESDPVLSLYTNGDYRYIQILAIPSEYDQYDLDLTRVQFTSNRTEWVPTGQSSLSSFSSQEECLNTGFYCESFVVTEGRSGFAQMSNGQKMALTNAHCIYTGSSYSYTVEAYVYDFSSYENIAISQIHTMDVFCDNY